MGSFEPIIEILTLGVISSLSTIVSNPNRTLIIFIIHVYIPVAY